MVSDVALHASRRAGRTICGRYRIERLIGMGGMAAVYAGRHRAGNRVAIKYLHARFSQDPDALMRFRREAYAANRVGHPGALPVLDDDVDEEGGVFLVMPLLEGETVRARWERLDRRLPVEEVAAIGAATLDVLAAAHANGIVHRDIKPENLFLTSEGVLFVLDFGVARVLQGGDESLATRTGFAIGTPAFMAPEQARGRSREIDGRTDVWAVGATMFSLVSGRYVHDAETGSEAMAFAATRPAPLLGDVAPEVAEGVRAVIDRALAYERETRWESARGMRDALVAASADSADARGPIRVPRGEPGVVEPMDATGERDLHVASTVVPKRVGDAGGEQRPALGSSAETHTAVVSRVGPQASFGRRVVLSFAVLGCLAAGGAYGIIQRRHPLNSDAPRSGSDGAAAADRKPSANPEAEALYLAGLRLVHDASWNIAVSKFERATALDPSFASAHLQIAAIAYDDTDGSRTHFNQALQLRALLSKSEQSLLDAIAPAFTTPPDWTGAIEKLISREKVRPIDADATIIAASFAYRVGDSDEAIALSDRALSKNAAIVAPLLLKGRALFQKGRLGDAQAALTACTTAVQGAADCLAELNDIDAYEGRCTQAEEGSRRLIAIDPSEPLWYHYLARAEYGRTGDLDAARAALDASEERVPAAERESSRHQHAFGLAVLRGDMETADREIREWERADADPAEQSHALRFQDLIDLEVEMDDRSRAADTAHTFLKRRTTWIANRRFDFEIVGWEGLYSAGTISRSEFVVDRGRWCARFPDLKWSLWDEGYAEAPLKTFEDAEDVLRQQPEELGFLMDVRTQDGYGEALRIAGRLDEAIPQLKRAAHNCRAIFFPIAHTRANLHLGLALEAVGDRYGACAAYATVVRRWGAVKASVTMQSARTHAEGLGCSRLDRQP